MRWLIGFALTLAVLFVGLGGPSARGQASITWATTNIQNGTVTASGTYGTNLGWTPDSVAVVAFPTAGGPGYSFTVNTNAGNWTGSVNLPNGTYYAWGTLQAHSGANQAFA